MRIAQPAEAFCDVTEGSNDEGSGNTNGSPVPGPSPDAVLISQRFVHNVRQRGAVAKPADVVFDYADSALV